jgi:hypothetical protein
MQINRRASYLCLFASLIQAVILLLRFPKIEFVKFWSTFFVSANPFMVKSIKIGVANKKD